jgi:hypothetical protein
MTKIDWSKVTAPVKLRDRYRLPSDPEHEIFPSDQVCTECGAQPGWHCWHLSSRKGGSYRKQNVRPHPARRWLSTCRACPVGCRECTQDQSDCECYEHG